MFGDKQFDGVGYPTPSSVPVDRGCRTATIPADAAWYGVFMGVLETLTDPKNWQQFEGGISREDAACYWSEIIDSLYLSAEEDDCVDCCPIFRRNPATGLIEGSYDGGVTWGDTPEGPYVGADGPPIAPTPPALAQGSDDEDMCAAAWNATDVIAQFYQQTAGQAAAGLYNAVLAVNQALYSINQTLLHFIYPTESQLAQALGFFDFDWPTYASAPTLDSDAMAALRCLLLDNASVTAGIVSFDQPAVLAGVVAALGTNPGVAVELLIGYMDVAGLNAAGGVKVNDHPDCSDCGEFTHTFDFTVDDQGFFVFDSNGSYSAGVGWVDTDHSFGGTHYRGVTIALPVPAGTVMTSVIANYTRTGGFCTGGSELSTSVGVNGGTTDIGYCSFPNGPTEWDGMVTSPGNILARVMCGRRSSVDPGGSVLITSIVVTGVGADPF